MGKPQAVKKGPAVAIDAGQADNLYKALHSQEGKE
jgi:hypothetical protein